MQREEIFKTVSIIVETVSGWDDIKPLDENTVLKMIGIDSLDKVEIVMMVEKEYHIEIPDSDIDEVRTVGDIVNIVLKLADGNTATTPGN